MTVKELIARLAEMPQDAQVVGCWDNSWSKIEAIDLLKDDKGRDVVDLDVSSYGSYRED